MESDMTSAFSSSAETMADLAPLEVDECEEEWGRGWIIFVSS